MYLKSSMFGTIFPRVHSVYHVDKETPWDRGYILTCVQMRSVRIVAHVKLRFLVLPDCTLLIIINIQCFLVEQGCTEKPLTWCYVFLSVIPGFTLLALDMPNKALSELQPQPVLSMMQLFGWDDMVWPQLVSRYLSHLIQNRWKIVTACFFSTLSFIRLVENVASNSSLTCSMIFVSVKSFRFLEIIWLNKLNICQEDGYTGWKSYVLYRANHLFLPSGNSVVTKWIWESGDLDSTFRKVLL